MLTCKHHHRRHPCTFPGVFLGVFCNTMQCKCYASHDCKQHFIHACNTHTHKHMAYTPLKLGSFRSTLATTHVSCRMIQNSIKAPSKALMPPQSHRHSLAGCSGVHQMRLACKHRAGSAYQVTGSHHALHISQQSMSFWQHVFAYQAVGSHHTLTSDNGLCDNWLCPSGNRQWQSCA